MARNFEIGSSYEMGASYGRTVMAQRMADVFERDNPRFDRKRFLKACAVKEA